MLPRPFRHRADPLFARTFAIYGSMLCSVYFDHFGATGGGGEVRRRARDDDEEGEWLPVLPPAYAAARARHAKFRAQAYEAARDDVIERGVCGPELRITDIDSVALGVWEISWRGVHPSGAGGWNWRSMLENVPRRAAVLPIAVWYEDDLCGLALGQASRRRVNGSRHTITLTYVERRPEPPDVPLRGDIITIATTVAREYGLIIGGRHLRLRAPDRNLLQLYERYGFKPVWKGGIPVHCEREIRPW